MTTDLSALHRAMHGGNPAKIWETIMTTKPRSDQDELRALANGDGAMMIRERRLFMRAADRIDALEYELRRAIDRLRGLREDLPLRDTKENHERIVQVSDALRRELCSPDAKLYEERAP